MNELTTVIVALITAVGGIVGVILTNNKSNREISLKLDKNQAVYEAHVNEKIDNVIANMHRLEAKQDKYNNVIERTFALEKTTELQGAEIKRHGERIKVLEGGK